MKKFLSIALALLMVCVMLPVVALADEGEGGGSTVVAKIGNTEYATLAEAINAVQAKQSETTVIELLNDAKGGFDIGNSSGTEWKDITIKMNGFTLSIVKPVGSTGTVTNGVRVLAYSKLTMIGGTVTANNSPDVKVGFANYGTLVLDSIMIKDIGGALYTINNRGDLTIKGGTVVPNGGTNPNIAITNDPYNYFYTNTNATLNVNDENVTIGDILVERYGNKTNSGVPELNISAGKVSSIKDDGNSAISVMGNVTGGTFSSDVTEYAGNNLVVSDGTNYYVGATATSVVSNATSGTFTVVNGSANVDLTVKGGVTVKNGMAEGTVTVNGKTLEVDKEYTAPTVIIISGDTTPAETPKTEDQKNPSTGANDFVGLAAAAAVVALLGSAVVLRKK